MVYHFIVCVNEIMLVLQFIMLAVYIICTYTLVTVEAEGYALVHIRWLSGPNRRRRGPPRASRPP